LSVLLLGDAANWADYRRENALTCVGPFASTQESKDLSLAGKAYRLNGSRLVALDKTAPSEVRFGVLSSIKDFSPETKANLDKLLKWFVAEDVQWLVLNGDISGEEEELSDLLAYLVSFGRPLLLTIGNYESRGSYFRAVSAAADASPLVIDMNLVRVIEAPGVTVVSMPGYYDRRFLHTGSGCLYKTDDVDDTLDALVDAPTPRLLVSHGPPRGTGTKSIDVVAEGRVNVGDPDLTRLIRSGDFAFGLFGHILEAGGRAVGSDLATPVREEQWSPRLYVNAGSASASPWTLDDGTTSSGMAAVMTIAGNKAKVAFKIFKDHRGGAPFASTIE
jgi:Icc-related predicted phosphoesterase